MTQFESDVSGQELISPAQVLPVEFIDDTNTEATNITRTILDLSGTIEHLETIDFWELNGLDSEQITHIVMGLASARRALGEVVEILAPTVVPDDVPQPEEMVVPLGRSEKTSREDYGESIFPSGARFLVDVPDVGQKVIEFGDKGILIGDSKLRLGFHELYLLTLFLRNPQQAFTREDIANGGYHPRQPYLSNRLVHLSAHLPSLRRNLARVLTGVWYSEGPIYSANVGSHLAFTWVYHAIQQETAKREENDITTQVESEPIDQAATDTSATFISDQPSEIYGQADVHTAPEVEVDVGLGEETNEPKATPRVEHDSTKADLTFSNDKLFVNGHQIEVTEIESDVMRFMVVTGQTRSIKFEQLLKWLKPVHPRLSVDGLSTVIDSLNKPLRFYGIRAIVKVEYIESGSGTGRRLSLGEDFAHRHFEDGEVQTFLAKYLSK